MLPTCIHKSREEFFRWLRKSNLFFTEWVQDSPMIEFMWWEISKSNQIYGNDIYESLDLDIQTTYKLRRHLNEGIPLVLPMSGCKTFEDLKSLKQQINILRMVLEAPHIRAPKIYYVTLIQRQYREYKRRLVLWKIAEYYTAKKYHPNNVLTHGLVELN